MKQGNIINIAIDGPSGAGKTSLARNIAEKLGFLYVDTGAIYRAVALYALKSGTNPQDGAAVTALLPEIQVKPVYESDGVQHMYLNHQDVTDQIRTPEVSMAASQVAAYPGVRVFLLETQRKLAKEHDVVMDGRDIGTVVLPNADVKIFLTASAEERAWRRTLQLDEQGMARPYAEVLEDLRKRDYNDSNRSVAPLRQADDAVSLDTTHLTFSQSAAALEKIIWEKTGVGEPPVQEHPGAEYEPIFAEKVSESGAGRDPESEKTAENLEKSPEKSKSKGDETAS